MHIRRYTLDDCHEAAGVVVVVDVLRAFTTAAWALHRGAAEILLTAGVDEALALRDAHPGAWIMGEVDGLPLAEFDLPNSPAAIGALDLGGRRLVHRSTAGSLGASRVNRATHLFAASLPVAAATAKRIRSLEPTVVSFVETGVRPGDSGDEDAACADYIAGLLLGIRLDPAAIRDRVMASPAGRRFADPSRVDLPAADLECALEIDRFDFAMLARRRDGMLVLSRA